MDKIKAIKNIGKLKLSTSTIEEIYIERDTETEKIEGEFREDSCLLVRLMTEWTSRNMMEVVLSLHVSAMAHTCMHT